MHHIETLDAPAAIGPYSQAIVSGGFVFCSGQISLTGDTASQAEQVLHNLSEVLTAAGSSLAQVVKTTIFLVDMEDFSAVNEVYSRFFDGAVKPARSTVEVRRLPKDVRIEIECIAEVTSS